ncbi:MAG: Acetylglutamate kinase [Alphaproteobacteria bacterium MarineAlpha3_Bin5]|nr:acetylglutamate kinase [Magnetovibrio sp.]PPR78097.1 MAG: Acetylglutamate kinase [Alphaproteobacteria bacterium MarineAlpha3_Bin5]
MSKNDTTLLKRDWIKKAQVLSEALPFLRRYTNENLVIKYGGNAMIDPQAAKSFALDMVLLRQVNLNPIIVHGGGPQITQTLEKMDIKSQFVEGLRVTDETTIKVVEMVLSGSINKSIVSSINTSGGCAVGISGKDGNLVQARRHKGKKKNSPNLGLVGEPSKINPHILEAFQASKIIPVVAPIGIGEKGETLNINSDTLAGAIASTLAVKRLYILTDVPGVLDKKGQLITDMAIADARALIKNGTISGGMIPKIKTCIDAVKNGVGGAVIIDGRIKHSILVELFSDGGAGTFIWPDK